MTRRPFIYTLGATAAAFTTRTRAAEPSAKKLGWALVGLGSLSTDQIAPALLKCQHSKLTAIVTGTPDKAAKWKARYGIPDRHHYDYDNFDTIISNPEVDVVYIVLPNSMHEEFTLRAAAAGKHVFCEKPMANNADECRRMIAAVAKAGRQLGIGYRCQFEPHHRECIRIAREKVLGTIKHIEAGFGFTIGDPGQWRLRKKLAGGGALMDVGIYALQAARYLTGEEPNEISATEAKTDLVKFAEVDETIAWSMKFPSGTTASLVTSYAFNGANAFTAYAEKGLFGVKSAFGYEGQSGFTNVDHLKIEFPENDNFMSQMDAFSHAILSARPFEPSGADGLKDLLAIDAIYCAIREGRAIVPEKA